MGDNASFLERLLPAVGDLVAGRYLLGKELGRGGFGVVFRATHQALKEDVALKILLPHVVSNTEFVDRFEREVMVAKALRHPNTINVLDYGRTEQELPYFVMEYVRGESLHELLQLHTRLSLARTQRVAIQILKSLAEAHASGVVHRDMKPANIMLCEVYGEQDFVKVLDFGIAKALSDPDNPGGFTQTGMLLGTPAYMSPEQARGVREIDGRSDLYAIGLIIAECIAGRPVVPNGPTVDMLRTLASPEPVVLPAIVEHCAMAGVVKRALNKERDARFPTAESMIGALQELVGLPEGRDTDRLMGDALTPLPTPGPAQATPGLPVPSSPISDRVSPPSAAIGRKTQSEEITQPDLSNTPAPSQPMGEPPKTTPMPAMLVGEADPAARTRASMDMPPADRPKSKLPVALAALGLFLVATVAIVVFAVLGGDDPVLSEGGDIIAAPAEPPKEPIEPTVETAENSDPVAPVDPAVPSEAEQYELAVTLAHNGVGMSLPFEREVRFEGTEDASVRSGDRTLGVVPFTLHVAPVDASLEIVADRRGYRSHQQTVSLLDDVVTVTLRARRSRSTETVAATDDNAESTNTPGESPTESGTPETDEDTNDETGDDPGVPSFGTIRIDRE